MSRGPRRLVIVSAAIHHRHDGRLWSGPPYVREIEIWSDLFPEVLIAGPVVDEPPPDGSVALPLGVGVVGMPATGGETASAKLHQVLLLPLLVWRLCVALRRADAVHVRCPGNIGLLGVLIAPLFRRRLVAKYAGLWTGFPGEVWTVRLQRALLRSPWWRGPVTVYGRWPGQPAKVEPFFTSVLTSRQIERAREVAAARRRHPGRLDLLYVGRLTAPKNVRPVVEAVGKTAADGVDVRLTIVGDGGERENLGELVDHLDLRDRVTFAGAVDLDGVIAHYERADSLVLVSESEGWPKAIAEAMTFGLVCVGSDRGLIPEMLGEGRGLVVPPGDVDALVERLRWLGDHADEADSMGRRASEWASEYSLEDLRDAIADLLARHWEPAAGARADRISVLHVTDTLDAGGAERVAVNVANLLPRGRFRASVCTTRRGGVLADELSDDVEVLALERTRRALDLVALLRLARFLRRRRVDVVHAHGTSLFIAAAARLFSPGTRLVWHDHLGAGTHSRRRLVPLYRLVARRADRIITVNHELQAWTIDRLGVSSDRVRRIPNFVLAPSPTTEPELPGTPGHRIAVVANLRRHKDHLTLVRALARVVESDPDAHALLLGAEIDPQIAEELRAEIARLGLGDHLSLLGSRADVGRVLTGCTIGVLSSRSEGFPLALLEYGTAALPVVATDVGDCAEILEHGRVGIVVPPADPAALAEAIVSLLADPAERRRLGLLLHERVAATYDADAVMAEVISVYEALAGSRADMAPAP